MLCLSYYAYVFSSKELDIRTDQVLPGSEGVEGERVGARGRAGEITQTVYAHVNK
jgi:hypothetical protein